MVSWGRVLKEIVHETFPLTAGKTRVTRKHICLMNFQINVIKYVTEKQLMHDCN